jgi:hypothetical protein
MRTQFRRLLLFTFCALLLGACSLDRLKGASEKRTTSGNNPSSAGSAFTPSDDARKDLREALMRLNTAYPYRLTENTSGTANGQMAMPGGTRVVEFAAADRSHMKWTGGPSGDVEAISIGDKHYWYSDGKWTEGSLQQRTDRGLDFAKKLAEMVKEVKYVGPESVNGVACHAYTCTFEMPMAGQNWTGTAKVWIGAGDGLIHQSDSEYNVATYSGKSHTVYEYNVNVNIEPPM